MDFLSRPVLVLQEQIEVGVNYISSVNPWNAFFTNDKVLDKLSHFRNLRCDLEIKIILNGNPFYYGSFIASYRPLHLVDSRTTVSEGVPSIIQNSQMPHVYLDPCTGTGGTISVPYFYNKDAMNIIEGDWDSMGLLELRTIYPLTHALGNTDPIEVSVFVMAKNVALSTPTSYLPMENQSDEYTKPSAVAHAIAKKVGWFAHYPVIGKYARATQMISSAAGDVAALFGFSRPRVVLESTSYRNRPTANLAVTNIPDNVASLALDAKKEVTIDPRVVGLKSEDEMLLSPIAQRESFLTVFPWSDNAGGGTHLFSVYVNPIQGDKDILYDDYYITPSAFTSLPFQYWRGSMRFRFNVIASAYHRGRLKFVWDPECNRESSADSYNTNYIKIVDISQDKDVTIDVGWGSNYSYLQCGGFTFPKFSSLPFDGPNVFANGTLSVYVVNTLTSPGEVSSDAAVSVFTSMLDDYEVAGPDDSFLQGNLTIRDNDIPLPPPRGPIGGDDGTGPQPPEIPGDPDPGVPLVIPDGIGFGNDRRWPNPPLPQGVPINRSTGEANLPNQAPILFVVPPFVNGASLKFFTRDGNAVTVEHLQSDASTVISSAVLGNGPGLEFTVNVNPAEPSLMSQDYHYLRITTANALDLVRLVNLEITGVVFRRLTVEELAPTLNSGPVAISNGKATVNFANVADSLQLAVPDLPITSKPIMHYSFVGVPGAVHFYGRLRADTASPTFKYAIGDKIVYTTPGKVVFKGGDIAVDSLGPFSLEGMVLMYYPPMENQSEEIDQSAAPIATGADEHMGPSLPGMEVNSVYFGEQATSWRQLLKRYETISLLQGTDFNFRWHDGISDDEDAEALNLRRVSFNTYVKSAYVGVRGGMRLKVLPLSDPSSCGTISISRISAGNRGATNPIYPGWVGSTFDPVSITGAADAEIPYYSNLRFFTARTSANLYSGKLGPSIRTGLQRLESWISVRGGQSQYIITQAVAEDYSLHFFLAAPVLTLGASIPPVLQS